MNQFCYNLYTTDKDIPVPPDDYRAFNRFCYTHKLNEIINTNTNIYIIEIMNLNSASLVHEFFKVEKDLFLFLLNNYGYSLLFVKPMTLKTQETKNLIYNLIINNGKLICLK